jgi:energy-coupling factor transporter ATP-binding protein EcfA2
VLDEPVAMLDPIARHDFMATVLTAATDDGVSVLLSSHGLAELERVADYLIVMSFSPVGLISILDVASALRQAADLVSCGRRRPMGQFLQGKVVSCPTPLLPPSRTPAVTALTSQ